MTITQSLLVSQDITYCDLSDADLINHPDETFLQVLQLAQLIIEYLVDAQDTLAANLNGLAKKYSAKKREIETLSKNLAAQDVEIATLRDELHNMKPSTGVSLKSTEEAMNRASVVSRRIDPSLYPSQERRPNTAPAGLEDLSSRSSSLSTSASQEGGSPIFLQIVLSTHALCIRMNVDDSVTILNLKNKLASRLLVAVDHSVDVGQYELYYKDEKLKYQYRTLKDYQVVNDAALILMPRPAEKESENTTVIESTGTETSNAEGQEKNFDIKSKLEELTSILQDPDKTSNIESKLDDLTSIATKSQEELIQATRTLQFQVSMQESSREAFIQEIGKQLENLDGAMRDEIQRRVSDVVVEHSYQRQRQYGSRQDDVQKHADDTNYSLPWLNVGGLVESDADCEDESKENKTEQDYLLSKNEVSSEHKYVKDSPADTEENRGKPDAALKIDTSAEVFDRESSPFNPPSEIEVARSDLAESPRENATEEVMEEESETVASSSIMHYSASSTQMASSVTSANVTYDMTNAMYDTNEYKANEDRTPTPSKGILDRKVPLEDLTPNISPPHSWTGAAMASSEKKRYEDEEARRFRFSDDSVQGIVEFIDYDADEYNTTASISFIPDTTLKISPGRPSMTMDSDLQSIEVSHSDFVSNDRRPDEADEEPNTPGGGKKKARFTLRLKKIVPKWKKSKGKGGKAQLAE